MVRTLVFLFILFFIACSSDENSSGVGNFPNASCEYPLWPDVSQVDARIPLLYGNSGGVCDQNVREEFVTLNVNDTLLSLSYTFFFVGETESYDCTTDNVSIFVDENEAEKFFDEETKNYRVKFSLPDTKNPHDVRVWLDTAHCPLSDLTVHFNPSTEPGDYEIYRGSFSPQGELGNWAFVSYRKGMFFGSLSFLSDVGSFFDKEQSKCELRRDSSSHQGLPLNFTYEYDYRYDEKYNHVNIIPPDSVDLVQLLQNDSVAYLYCGFVNQYWHIPAKLDSVELNFVSEVLFSKQDDLGFFEITDLNENGVFYITSEAMMFTVYKYGISSKTKQPVCFNDAQGNITFMTKEGYYKNGYSSYYKDGEEDVLMESLQIIALPLYFDSPEVYQAYEQLDSLCVNTLWNYGDVPDPENSSKAKDILWKFLDEDGNALPQYWIKAKRFY